MNHQDKLWAGAAKVDITPPLGTIINGDFVVHYAQYVHDPLYAKALLFRDGKLTLAIVVVDICVMGQELLDEAKALVAQKHSIPPSQILISSTHTHAAGAVEEVHLVQADLAYRKKIPGYILNTVTQAFKNLEPAKVAFGKVEAPEHVLCRRYIMAESYQPFNPVTGQTDQVKTNPFGAESQILRPVTNPDPELCFLAVQSVKGRWISVLGNYSLHYVGDWENGTLSADYFGVFSESMKKKLGAGEEFVGMMSNGTSGDVNVWDFINKDRYPKDHFAKSQLIGEALAEKVVSQIRHLQWDSSPELSASLKIIEVSRRMPTQEALQAAGTVVSTGGYERLVPDEEGLKKLYAREQLLLRDYPFKATCPLQVLGIGKARIGGLPGEFFAETGMRLKENSTDDPYFTISLANGNVGYVPPAHELESGGYETWRCRISNLETDAEAIIRKTLSDMIKKSKNH